MNTPLEIKDKSQPKKAIKIEPFRKHVRKTSAHKHNSYFELVFLKKGSGSHTIDQVKYPISPSVVFSIRKDQVHHWDISSEPEGYVIIIKNDFINDCTDNEIKQLIYQLSKYNYLVCEDETLDDFFLLLYIANKQDTSLQSTITEGLIKALFGKLLQFSETTVDASTIKEQNFQRFITLINHGKTIINSVAHYATLMNTTPQNLNNICRKEANKTASQVLSDHIIAESKRLLLYTNLSINEVAHHLNFSDNSNFTK